MAEDSCLEKRFHARKMFTAVRPPRLCGDSFKPRARKVPERVGSFRTPGRHNVQPDLSSQATKFISRGRDTW